MLQELRAIFSLLRQSITFSKILFFHTLLSNGITDSNLRNSKSISVFKERILNFVRPSPIFFLFFDCHNPKRIKLITRLRLGLSHLRERKFKHGFQDTISPLCNCGQDIKSAAHFFLHCPFFINEIRTLLSTIRSLDRKLLDCTDYDLTQTLLFGNTSQTSSNNFKLINASIDYILSSKRSDETLFKINSFISKSEFNQQFSFLYICLLLSLAIFYSQVLSGILVSGDRVILFSIFYVK